jgi:DNA-binding winged helix-turn-helix (wHTH) protein
VPTRWRVSDLVLDVRRQRVWREAQEIPLPKLSYDLFVELIRRAPEVASNEDLMKAVWPGLIVTPETVSQRVKLLRNALGDESRTPRYIGSLRARGYHLVPPVESLEDDRDPGLTGEREIGARLAEAALRTGDDSQDAAAIDLSLLESETDSGSRARPDWAVTHLQTPQTAQPGAASAASRPAASRERRADRASSRWLWPLVAGVVALIAVAAIGFLWHLSHT